MVVIKTYERLIGNCIFTLVLISMSSLFVIGEWSDSDLDYCWDFTGYNLSSRVGGVTFTNNGASNEASGLIGEAIRCDDGSSDYLESGANSVDISDYTTVILWVSDANTGDNNRVYSIQDTGAYPIFNLLNTDTNTLAYHFYNGGSDNINVATANPISWTMYTHSYDDASGVYHFWINESYEGNDTTPNSYSVHEFFLCSNGNGNENWNGVIDEVKIFGTFINPNDNQSFVEEMYNSGLGVNCTPEEDSPECSPSLLLNTDFVNNTGNISDNHISGYFNGTMNLCEYNDLFNCSVFVNGVHNFTETANLSENNLVNITFGEYSDYWNISINCSNGESEDGTGVFIYQVDNVNPFVSSDFVNNSQLTVDDLITITSNFTDDNLFAYNITIKGSSGNVLHNVFAENITVSSILNVTSYTPTSSGNYSLWLKAWDSHTDLLLTDTPIKIAPNVVEFKGVVFHCNYSQVDYTLFKDKLVLDIIKKDKVQEDCYYTTPGRFLEVKNSKYPNHYVDLTTGVWIDEYDKSLVMQDNMLKLTVSESYTTKSIGALNEKEIIYQFSAHSTDTLLLTSINSHLSNIYDLLDGVLNMIPLILLYGLFLVMSYYLVNAGQFIPGLFLYITTIGFDFLFVGYYWNYFQDSLTGLYGQFVTVFLVFMTVWLTTKLAGIFFLKNKSRRLV